MMDKVPGSDGGANDLLGSISAAEVATSLSTTDLEQCNNSNKYVDYSKLTENSFAQMSTTLTDQPSSKEHSFPFQLHFMLSEVERDGLR